MLINYYTLKYDYSLFHITSRHSEFAWYILEHLYGLLEASNIAASSIHNHEKCVSPKLAVWATPRGIRRREGPRGIPGSVIN